MRQVFMAMGLLQYGCSVPLAWAFRSRTFTNVTVNSLKKASQMESRLLLGLSEEQLQQLALDFGQVCSFVTIKLKH